MKDSSLFTLHSSLSIGADPRSGTVLMEAVLCLPILLFLVSAIVQFARIWEARLFTKHAAYNAARAALVYNVEEYASSSAGKKIEFRPTSGPVWLAAVNTLAWKSATHSSAGRDADYAFPGFGKDPDYRIANSAFIRQQVRIDKTGSWESNGAVRVTVQFKFPLLFSVFALGAMQGHPDEDPAPLVHPPPDSHSQGTRWDDAAIPHILLTESCTLPKPWSSARHPRVSSAEASYLEMSQP